MAKKEMPKAALKNFKSCKQKKMIISKFSSDGFCKKDNMVSSIKVILE